MGSEGLRQVFYMQDIVSTLTGRDERNMHVAFGFCGPFQSFHFGEHFFAAFRTLDGFFTVIGLEFGNHVFLVLDDLLLFQIGMPPGGAVLCLFFRVGSVISKIDTGMRLIDFDHLAHNAVQKVTVVRDDQDSRIDVFQISFQPGNRSHVEMVCGLVQKDQIRGCE